MSTLLEPLPPLPKTRLKLAMNLNLAVMAEALSTRHSSRCPGRARMRAGG